MAQSRDAVGDDLPQELEYLRKPALELVGSDQQIVSCSQVDFSRLERALQKATQGLTRAQAQAQRARRDRLLGQWLATHEASSAPLVTGMRFVSQLLQG